MLVVDIETTGINPQKNSIISIGAVNFKHPKKKFYSECKIFEGAEINLESLKINGFTKAEISFENKDKKTLRNALIEFLDWVKEQRDSDAIIAGQNPSFDRDFLIYTCERYQIRFPFTFRTIDLNTLTAFYIIKNNINTKINSLNTNRIYTLLGMPEEPNPHNALTGAIMEAEAFSRLIYGKNLIEEFKEYKIPENLVLNS